MDKIRSLFEKAKDDVKADAADAKSKDASESTDAAKKSGAADTQMKNAAQNAESLTVQKEDAEDCRRIRQSTERAAGEPCRRHRDRKYGQSGAAASDSAGSENDFENADSNAASEDTTSGTSAEGSADEAGKAADAAAQTDGEQAGESAGNSSFGSPDNRLLRPPFRRNICGSSRWNDHRSDIRLCDGKETDHCL